MTLISKFKNRFFSQISKNKNKTEIAYNFVNIEFMGKIREFCDHSFQNQKIGF